MMFATVSYTHLDVYKRQAVLCLRNALKKKLLLNKIRSLYLITGVNWRTQCKLLPSLMMVSDGETETSVSIDPRPRPNILANNVSNYTEKKQNDI